MSDWNVSDIPSNHPEFEEEMKEAPRDPMVLLSDVLEKISRQWAPTQQPQQLKRLKLPDFDPSAIPTAGEYASVIQTDHKIISSSKIKDKEAAKQEDAISRLTTAMKDNIKSEKSTDVRPILLVTSATKEDHPETLAFRIYRAIRISPLMACSTPALAPGLSEAYHLDGHPAPAVGSHIIYNLRPGMQTVIRYSRPSEITCKLGN
ncbi:hypothetical protein GE061_020317 [Apolygus lucorum]|uniref:Uncharacterized protein n=1 Tax=Apolygus lucorum TaxID=248454 RepID=A0A8S9WNA1_APOLU|nr:hypothetical protein GE061_020317 [Apolygus lucorum]